MLHPEQSKLNSAFSNYPAFQGKDQLNSKHFFPLPHDKNKALAALSYEPASPIATLIVSGGNAASLSSTVYYYRFLIGQNIRIVYFSFSGFDESDGEASLANMLLDAKHIIKDLYDDEVPLFYLTHSISTAIALCVANHKQLSGIILEAPVDLTKIASYKAKELPLHYLFMPIAHLINHSASNQITNCTKPNQKPPALFIHNKKDRVTPYELAIDIFEYYPAEKIFITTDSAQAPQFHQSAWADRKVQPAIFNFIHQHIKNKKP